jgi:hypothetical protein
MRIGAAVASLALMIGAAAGCGGGKSSGSGGGPVALDDLSDEVTAAECGVQVRCGFFSDLVLCQQVYAAGKIGAAAFTAGWMPGFNPAPAIGRQDFNSVAAIVAAARASKARYDGAAAKTCLDAIGALACGDISNAPAVLADACQAVFMGMLADGERCISDLECGAHSFCSTPPTSSPCDGTCTAAGPLCNADRQCPSGQACSFATSTSTSSGSCVALVPPGAAGQPCGTNARCQADLTCNPQNTCVAFPQAGASCDPNSGVPFPPCEYGLVCAHSADMLTMTCMEPAMKGASCQASDQCGGMFSSLSCDVTQHHCVDWAIDGPCSAGCPYTAYCDQSSSPPTCKADLPPGSACQQGGDECGMLGFDCRSPDQSAIMGTCTSLTPPTCTP